MDLLKDIFIKILKKKKVNILFPNFQVNINEVAESICYETLK